MLGTRSAECKGAECVVRASEMNGRDQEASLGVYNSAGLVVLGSTSVLVTLLMIGKH